MICQELGKTFSTTELDFEDRDHAMLWIINNQLGRRNLNDKQFSVMIATEYNLTKKIEGGDKKSEDHKKSLDENHQVIGSTRERIATKHNVTPWKVQTSVELAEALDAIKEVAPEMAVKLTTEEIDVSKKNVTLVGQALNSEDAPEDLKEELISDLKEGNFQEAVEPAKAMQEALEPPKELQIHEEPALDYEEPEPEQEPEPNQPLPNRVPTAEQLADLKKYFEDSKEHKDFPQWAINWGNTRGLLSIASDDATYPKCCKPAKLILRWTCCDMSLEEAAELAVEVVDDELAKSRERLIAKGGGFACLDITK
ncbi:Uncharacterised protein [uncultured archaeon]|nr:Uncharacterised protein [uncultured archaeon]